MNVAVIGRPVPSRKNIGAAAVALRHALLIRGTGGRGRRRGGQWALRGMDQLRALALDARSQFQQGK